MNPSAANAKSIFLQAVELPAGPERRVLLDAQCGGDANLRREVEELLRHQAAAGSFLETPPTQVVEAQELFARSDQPSLAFLAPAQQSGSLGRIAHYEILEVVGVGGMGIVLRAFDEKLHRVVAIKMMAESLAAVPSARRRFTREARSAAAVRNDHVVGIYEVEESAVRPYLVMEFISGVSLQQRIDRTGPLRPQEIFRIGMQIAQGLAAAHAQGLVHRDIKPSNILLENGVERFNITYFGLARVVDDASVTQTGIVAGTPQYMAPEQARGEPVDHRADLFSLGSVLYAMSTGQAPFRGSTTLSVLKRLCEETPQPIRENNPDVPQALVALIERLHAKDPAQRLQSASEVAELLSDQLVMLQHPAGSNLQMQVADCGSPAKAQQLVRIQNPNSSIRSRWPLALAAFFLFTIIALGLAEAGGVTQITATVIKIFTPEGTLIVETSDPGVQVTIEGDGGLAITGAGPQEVRVRPGSYKVQATKDGKLLTADRELVAISKGGREVVKIRHEPLVQDSASSLPAPKLIAPPAGGIVPNGRWRDQASRYTWDFRWAKVSRADRYQLQVISPTGAVIADVEVVSTSYLHVRNGGFSRPDADWLWRVRAANDGEWGPWSEERSFRPAEPAGTAPGAPGGPPNLALVEAEHRATLRTQPGDLANLLSQQGKLDDAQNEARELVRRSPEDPAAHETLARICARSGRWDLVEAALTEAAKLAPENHLYWFYLAALRLELGDRPGYESVCQEMLTRFATAEQPEIRERTAKSCLLSSEGGGQLDRANALTEALVEAEKSHKSYWYFMVTRALGEFRAGHHAQAIAWSEKAALIFKLRDRGPAYAMYDASVLAILAMAQQRAGCQAEARESFAGAQLLSKKYFPDPAAGRPYTLHNWHDWLMCRLLMREAEQTLQGSDSPAPAESQPLPDRKAPRANPP